MHITLFKELKLEDGERIYVVNEKGAGIFGNYKNEYNRSAKTFAWFNSSIGRQESVEIEKMQRIERAKN